MKKPHLSLLRLITVLVYFASIHPVISAIPSACHLNDATALLQFKGTLTISKSASSDRFAYPKMLSWNEKGDNKGDCCSWDGVTCDGDTGYVIGLELESSFLSGSIDSNSSLFRLSSLQHLNLADNNFGHSPIPAAMGKLSRLRYLNLSSSAFSGQIPSEISELRGLTSLDLSHNPRLKLHQKLSFRDLVRNLTGLRELHLSMVDISSAVPETLTNLTSLTSLLLSSCRLYGEFPAGVFHLPKLETLSLTYNKNLSGHLPEFHGISALKSLRISGTNFSGNLPGSIGNLNKLTELDLKGCDFWGSIPTSFGNFSQLAFLDLSLNNFEGEIPSSFANFSNHFFMDFSYNNFKGPIPTSLGNSDRITHLSFAYNNFTCENLVSLGKLSSLRRLILSENDFNCDIPSSFANLTQLDILAIRSSKLTGRIPTWIGNLTQLRVLALPSNLLHGRIPESLFQVENLQHLVLFGNNLSGDVNFDTVLQLRNLYVLQLSDNQLSMIPNSILNRTFPKLKHLELRSCSLLQFPSFLRNQTQLKCIDLENTGIQGLLPHWISNMSIETLFFMNLPRNLITGFENPVPPTLPWKNLAFFDISYNMLEGPLPDPPPSTVSYIVSNNRLGGEIPSSICNLSSIYELDLSFNNLTGNVPQCSSGGFADSLSLLNLGGNNLHGLIPQLFNDNCNLQMIDLSRNILQGQVPISLVKCTLLVSLNLRNNLINDTFPFWLGALPELKVLILGTNKFYGTVTGPRSNFSFPKLRIIDISHNSFSGNLPTEYFQTWNAMKLGADNNKSEYMQASKELACEGYEWEGGYNYSMVVMNKGVEREYQKILTVLTMVDLSSNKFEGEIPESIGNLKELRTLNLSHNNLNGHIPSSIVNLTVLESLDLSDNKLSGNINQRLTQLTFLSVLNVSSNNLTGPIPRGNQFNTYGNDSFKGNPGLCGVPLSKTCKSSEGISKSASPSSSSNEEEFPTRSDLIAICTGYGSGLLVGLAIGWIFTVWKHEWFVRRFNPKRMGLRH